jgi:hypothetical protein
MYYFTYDKNCFVNMYMLIYCPVNYKPQKKTVRGNQAKKIELKNTLYAPDFTTNLLSIAKIVDKNRKVLFTKNRAFIQDRRGRVKMIADRDRDLFYLRENHQKACATSVTMTCDIF